MTTDAALVTFIGGGNMARSLIAGLIQAGTAPECIEVIEPHADARAALSTYPGLRIATDIASTELTGNSWVLAVKPQVMPVVCSELAQQLPNGQLVVSIAAGITTTSLQGWLGDHARIIRAMPNTPALLGAGMTGLYATPSVNQADRDAATQILSASGQVRWISDETLMDAITAVSGSGPAYVFALAEAMEASAQREGLDEEAARQLVVQTILGAARMLAESGSSATTLRQAVTSPNGTTQAALETLANGHFPTLIGDAIHAARKRGEELARHH